MSLLSYNGIYFPYGATTDFVQEALRDDLSDTDWYCTKFDISTQAVVNINYLQLLAPDLVNLPREGRGPADIMDVIRTRLIQHRRSLAFTFNDRNLIPSVQNGLPGTVDAQNGPKPQYCKIDQLTDTSFLITYRIIAHYWENPNPSSGSFDPTNAPGNVALYNRWSETMDINKMGYTKRTRNGKMMIRSDNVQGFIADQVRAQMCIVGVPRGFLRESASYTVTPDGLAIQYQVVDAEQFKMPPAPAFEARGEYIESTPLGGALRFGEVRIHLKADKVTSQATLVDIATSVAVAKVKLGSNNNRPLPSFRLKDVALIQMGAIKVWMYDNEVEVQLKVMYKANKKQRFRQMRFGFINTDTPGSDGNAGQNYTPAYKDRGSASRFLQAARYYDPSLQNVVLGENNGNLSGGLDVGTAGVNKEQ